jgi:hypothetical protein
MPMLIPTAEVAARLNISADTLLDRRVDLALHHGFPMPLPHSRRPLLWDAAALDSWIAAQGAARPAQPATPTPGFRPYLVAKAGVA